MRKSGKLLLISSHPRSGTHFLIDSILANNKESVFPYLKTGDFNLQKLYIDNLQTTTEIENKIKRYSNHILLIKSHTNPTEIEEFKKRKHIHPKTKSVLIYIWTNSIKLYIKRDPVETLKSLWKYSIDRDQKYCTFNEFLEKPFQWYSHGKKLPTIRNKNRVDFWKKHVLDWQSCDAHVVLYSDLLKKFQKTMSTIFEYTKIGADEKPFMCPKKLNRRNIFELTKWKLYTLGFNVRLHSTNPFIKGKEVGDIVSESDLKYINLSLHGE